ncbi:MAG: hypothetical protein ACNA8O_14345 [Cyanobacteriota bacterium]
MGADTLLTLLGLLIAAYAVLPVERQLDLKLRLKSVDWLVAGTALFLVLYIQFYPVLSSLRIAPYLGRWRWGFDKENASLLIVLGSFIFIFLRAQRARVQASSIKTFRTLIERLISEGKYSSGLFLLEQHLEALFRIYIGENSQGNFRRHRPSSRLQIASSNDSETAQDVVRRCLLNEQFVSYLAKARPYFALEVLSHEFREREEFMNQFLVALLHDKTSVIYHEIKHNQNCNHAFASRYIIHDYNRLIHYFLADARVAERMEIWRPFGDFVIKLLDDQFYKHEHHAYNGAIGSYREDGRWRCPVNASIWFFNAMVIEALYQGIAWHMWLYYFPQFTKRILRNMDPTLSDIDTLSELPTPYHYLLNEIFEALCGWIESGSNVPCTQENIALKSTRIDHENGNIPKSAMLALGIALREAMLSRNVDTSFRSDLLEGILRCYFDLLAKPSMREYSMLFQDIIANGGFSCEETQREYIDNLSAALAHVDHIPFPCSAWSELVNRVNSQ